ncbi:MAG: CDP-alcohol phosphatidyltransferase family protein [Hyphomicrobiales bacterium]|nr:CDP-alcohol phosphatidyltransferase family protein [Hyphomicrobiales bacterium]
MLVVGTEIAALGVLAISLCAIGNIRIGQGGLLLGSAIYLVMGALIIKGLGQHFPHSHFGLANAITLVRTAFSSFLFALSADMLAGNDPLSDPFVHWLITGLAAASLIFDGVDGWIARHLQTESRFGAQFDMHADAFFVLSLAVLLSISGLVGVWVMLSGLMFYIFQLAGQFWPWLTGSLPPRWRRKFVCVLQASLLIAALAPVTPAWAAQLACLVGLAALTWSFAIDALWLAKRADQ